MKCRTRTDAEKTLDKVAPHICACTAGTVCETLMDLYGFGARKRVPVFIEALHEEYDRLYDACGEGSRYETRTHRMCKKAREDMLRDYGLLYGIRKKRASDALEAAETQDVIFISSLRVLHERFGFSLVSRGERLTMEWINKEVFNGGKASAQILDTYCEKVKYYNRICGGSCMCDIGFPEMIREHLLTRGLPDSFIRERVMQWAKK